MTVNHVLACILLAGAALFAVWAAKLRQGKWLNSISGNTFATKEELRLPYQRKMARETSVLVAACALLFVMLAYNAVFGMDRTMLYAASAGFFVFVVAGSAVVAVRANKAAKIDQREAGFRVIGWPTKERDLRFGGGKGLVIVQWICVGIAGMLPAIVIFAAHFLGWID